jgi:hypothetical protein
MKLNENAGLDTSQVEDMRGRGGSSGGGLGNLGGIGNLGGLLSSLGG